MEQPRIAVLLDTENRLHRDWQAFVAVWQETAKTWKDNRRQHFENDYLKELPGVLSRTNAELGQFRELISNAARMLADREPQA